MSDSSTAVGELTMELLQDAVAGRGVALRCRRRLQPAGGPGTKVFPPTYAGAVYATEKRRLPDREEPVECVLLDSVQSQANRMEEALQTAFDEGRFGETGLPVVTVDFGPYFPGDDQPEELRLHDEVGQVSSLLAPHRIADAILRDSLVDGEPFRQSTVGRAIDYASVQNATPLFELCPTALVFGLWDSTGPKGGLGAKFERALVSEIVGFDALYGTKTGSRIDPLGIQLKAGPLYQAKAGTFPHWTLEEEQAQIDGKKKPKTMGKDGRPSEANHGNVTPSISDTDRDGNYLAGGVTITHAEQTVVLSLAALRRLRFPPPGEAWEMTEEQRARDEAARMVLAALALTAVALADEAGMDLRSRCLLWSEGPATWEQLAQDGSKRAMQFDADKAIGMLTEAVTEAQKCGLPWRQEPVVLAPSPELVKLLVRSQALAIAEGGDGGEE